MIFPNLPPELWGFLGVLTGAIIPSVSRWVRDKDHERHESNRELIRLLNERVNLQQETLVDMEKEMRLVRENSYRTLDRSRLAVSLAAAHIVRLNNHIDMQMPPPPPDMPTELRGYIHEFLWETGGEAPKNVNITKKGE
jgi:hypothetical protein